MYPMVCFEQQGLCPLTTREYSKFPFLAGDKLDDCSAASARMESFHLTVEFLRCCDLDATANTEDKKIYFNWWDRENKFSKGARRAPP